jgi:hypothetical protein
MSQNRTFEIVTGTDKWTTRETRESVLAMLANRGLKAVKRGYTTWVIYENGKRCGSMQEIG